MKKFYTILAAFFLIISSYANNKPNILFILVDDLGYADLSINGCKDISTPAIDSIAKNGMKFTNGYVTAPQCAPSRTGIMTGMYQPRLGCDNNVMIDATGVPANVVMMPKRLKDLGYATGMVGKWHLGHKEGQHPNDKGFDKYFGFLGGGSHFFAPKQIGYIDKIYRNKEQDKSITGDKYLSFEFAKEANKMMDEFVAEKKPFFIYLAFNAPHSPLQSPPRYLGKISKDMDSPRKNYLALLLALDDAIKMVLDNLKKNKIEENTLVVFLSDNGGPTGPTGALNDPFRGVKGDMFEGGIHIPFFVQWKSKIVPGTENKTPVISLDLNPTFMELAGAKEFPSELDGKSLKPLFEGKELEKRKIYWRYAFSSKYPELYVMAMREGEMKIMSDWRAIDSRAEGVAPQDAIVYSMYNLDEDISESKDLSKIQIDRYNEMKKAFDKWNAELPVLKKIEMTKEQQESRNRRAKAKKGK